MFQIETFFFVYKWVPFVADYNSNSRINYYISINFFFFFVYKWLSLVTWADQVRACIKLLRLWPRNKETIS